NTSFLFILIYQSLLTNHEGALYGYKVYSVRVLPFSLYRTQVIKTQLFPHTPHPTPYTLCFFNR
ncbi:MAG: hypothetical protein SAK29_30250, partial [Scytonema sp. PMC 1069.18]|nr:hypothetical protein [Scytonema sp. PMC 1069.18]